MNTLSSMPPPLRAQFDAYRQHREAVINLKRPRGAVTSETASTDVAIAYRLATQHTLTSKGRMADFFDASLSDARSRATLKSFNDLAIVGSGFSGGESQTHLGPTVSKQ